MAHQLNWAPGNYGKGLLTHDNELHTWNTDYKDGDPIHGDYMRTHGLTGLDDYLFDHVKDLFWINHNGVIPKQNDATPIIQSIDPRLRGLDPNEEWTFSGQPVIKASGGGHRIGPDDYGKWIIHKGQPYIWKVNEADGQPFHSEFVEQNSLPPFQDDKNNENVDYSGVGWIEPGYKVRPASFAHYHLNYDESKRKIENELDQPAQDSWKLTHEVDRIIPNQERWTSAKNELKAVLARLHKSAQVSKSSNVVHSVTDLKSSEDHNGANGPAQSSEDNGRASQRPISRSLVGKVAKEQQGPEHKGDSFSNHVTRISYNKTGVQMPWGQDYDEWLATRPSYADTGHQLGYDPAKHVYGKGFVLNNGSVWTWPVDERMRPFHMAYAKKAQGLGMPFIPGSPFHIKDGQIQSMTANRELQAEPIIEADPRLSVPQNEWSFNSNTQPQVVESPRPGQEDAQFGWRTPLIWEPKINTIRMGLPGDYHMDLWPEGTHRNLTEGYMEGWIAHPNALRDEYHTEREAPEPPGYGLQIKDANPEELERIRQALLPHEPYARATMPENESSQWEFMTG